MKRKMKKRKEVKLQYKHKQRENPTKNIAPYIQILQGPYDSGKPGKSGESFFTQGKPGNSGNFVRFCLLR